jgi:hypothetical protein
LVRQRRSWHATRSAQSAPCRARWPSAGCGKTDGAENPDDRRLVGFGRSYHVDQTQGVTSGGKSRAVIIDVPADYDPTKPYRLIFSWRQMGGSDTGNATGLYPAIDGPNFDAEHYAYFGLRREALNAKEPAIFVAPDTDPVGGLWDYNKDSVYFDDLLKLVTDEPVHRREPGLHHRLQLRSDDELRSVERACLEAARRCHDGTEPIRPDHWDYAHRLYEYDRHDRWYVYVGQRHERRGGLRHSTR